MLSSCLAAVPKWLAIDDAKFIAAWDKHYIDYNGPEAIALFEAYLPSAPNQFLIDETKLELSRLYDYSQALVTVNEVILTAAGRTLKDAYFQKAIIYSGMNDYTNAKKAFDDVIARYPTDAICFFANYHMGELANKRSDYADMASYYTACIARPEYANFRNDAIRGTIRVRAIKGYMGIRDGTNFRLKVVEHKAYDPNLPAGTYRDWEYQMANYDNDQALLASADTISLATANSIKTSMKTKYGNDAVNRSMIRLAEKLLIQYHDTNDPNKERAALNLLTSQANERSAAGSKYATWRQLTLGFYHYKKREYTTAVTYFNQAKSSTEPSVVLCAYFRGARCYERLGDGFNAALNYQYVVDNFPGTDRAIIANKELGN